jgi:general secretion pathway protein J
VARHHPDAAQDGFTLLEVLVAVAVLGLLVLGLSQGLRTGIAMRHAQVQRLAETADLDATMRTLRSILTRLPLLPGGNRAAADEAGPVFKGAADRVSFIGELPTGLGATRRADMMLFVRNARLILSWAPRRHERSLVPAPPATETELLRGVERLELAYWKPVKDEPSGWQIRWDGPDIPELIRVRVHFAAGDRRRWPDLIAAPRP